MITKDILDEGRLEAARRMPPLDVYGHCVNFDKADA